MTAFPTFSLFVCTEHTLHCCSLLHKHISFVLRIFYRFLSQITSYVHCFIVSWLSGGENFSKCSLSTQNIPIHFWMEILLLFCCVTVHRWEPQQRDSNPVLWRMCEGKKHSRQKLWNTCGFLETSFARKKEHDRLSLAYREERVWKKYERNLCLWNNFRRKRENTFWRKLQIPALRQNFTNIVRGNS